MKSLRILHVASFTGNIGDNANHVGFKKLLKANLKRKLDFTRFEIREVYWGYKSFNEEFVELANSFDLVVIGGGNYFELWVDKSATGCSIDIELDLLASIKTPIVFNALGVDPAQGASALALNKFRKFLDLVVSKKNMLLSCRNDGSMHALENIVGLNYASEFYHIPDAGFFTEAVSTYHPEIDANKKNTIIQIAGDMIETRFNKSSPESIDYDEFISLMAKVVEQLAEMKSNIILVPHIFSDLNIINNLIYALPDNIRRKNIKVAPYLIGDSGQDYIFDLYKKSDLVLGMRFHANVCAMAMKTPCIGLVNYRQISELYKEIGQDKYAVHVNKAGFDKKIIDIAASILHDNEYDHIRLKPWEDKVNTFHAAINDLLA